MKTRDTREGDSNVMDSSGRGPSDGQQQHNSNGNSASSIQQQQQHALYMQHQMAAQHQHHHQYQHQQYQQYHQQQQHHQNHAQPRQQSMNSLTAVAPSTQTILPQPPPPQNYGAPPPPQTILYPNPIAAAPGLPTVSSSQEAAAAAAEAVSTVAEPAPAPAASKKARNSTTHAGAASTTPPPPPPLTLEQAQPLLAQCHWMDKTIWVSRQFMGGQAVNGFLKATASMQRMKKQRQRQVVKEQQQHGGTTTTANNNKKRELDAPPGSQGQSEGQQQPQTGQETEEASKVDCMNPRLAKKFKQDMEAGMEFCQTLYETIRHLIVEIDPSFTPPDPLTMAGVPTALLQMRERQKQGIPPPEMQYQHAPPHLQQMTNGSALQQMTTLQQTLMAPIPNAPEQGKTASASPTGAAASSGLASASTLRKSRKKKLAPSGEPPVPISEFDASGKRLCSKKEHSFRIAEFLRFRALRKGDLVAARLSSRDLWILARVENNYPTHHLGPAEFFQITEARRSQLFRDKVVIQDVEDAGSNQAVARDLVLPLPRSYSEGAEWCSRLKKGFRVYAMYPSTTSLYSATVIDSTTYARGDDDVVVVEFDGDELDAITGTIPKCHVPARFVTIIPRDFEAANAKPASSGGANTHGAPKANKKALPARTGVAGVDDVSQAANMALSGDDMNFDFGDDALPGLDFADMDFTM